MSEILPSIEFFEGLQEQLSNVKLRRNKATGIRNVLFIFESLQAIERFNSFRKQFNGSLRLIDSEGQINVEPSGVQFVFAGEEGDDLKRVECSFEIYQEENWERFMRFMNRYAEANGFAYTDKKPEG